MIITITDVHQEFTKNGDEYRKVTGVTADGKETTKSIFNQLKDDWVLLVENATLEFTMVQNGQFWNVTAIKEVETPPAVKLAQVKTPDQAQINKDLKKTEQEIKNETLGMPIDRRCAIICANAVWVAGKLNNENEVIFLADKYLKYIIG